MTELSDNVQGAITAVLQSASIDKGYTGDLQHGHHSDTNKQSRSVEPEVTSNRIVKDNLDRTKEQQQQQQNVASVNASTATGLPDPSAIASAIDRVEEKGEKNDHDANDGSAVASTAIGMPDSEAIINALKEEDGGGGDNIAQRDSTNENASLSNTLQKTISTVTSDTPLAAAQNMTDNLTLPDTQSGPSTNPSKMKHQQQQPEKSCDQTDPSHSSENVKLSADADQNVQHATASVVNDVSFKPTAPLAMKEPTHTLIDDNTKSVEPTPVEPVVESIVANIQEVEEPVVMEEEIVPEHPAVVNDIQTMDSTRPTPADVRATGDLPNAEVRGLAFPAEEKMVVVTEYPAADEIKVEQVLSHHPTAAATTTTSDNRQQQMTSIAVADIKTEDMTVAEEPATMDDIKTNPMIMEQTGNDDGGQLLTDGPIKKDGKVHSDDVNVEQQPIIDGDITAKEVDDCAVAKENDTKDGTHQDIPDTTTTTTTVDDYSKSQSSSGSDKNVNKFNNLEPQQHDTSVDAQSRSIEHKSLPSQSSTEGQNQALTTDSTGKSQEQAPPESNGPKSSKCTIM